MGKVNYTIEEIIMKLREVEALCGQGKTLQEAVQLVLLPFSNNLPLL